MKTLLSNRIGIVSVFLLLSLVNSPEICAQVRVTRVTGPEQLNGKKGIVYNLPRTMVHVDLWIARTQQFAGPLAEYAGEYLSLDDVVTKNAVSYAISDVDIRTAIEPDPGQVYIIEKEDKSPGEIWVSFGKSAPVVTLEKFDKAVSPEGFVKWNEELFAQPVAGHLFREYTESSTREVIDTIIRKVSIDTLVLEEMTFRYSMVEFSDREKAQEAAMQIKQIERDKYNLLIGYQETAYSRETLEFMLNKLEEQRLEYLKLFTGVSVTETLKFDYMIIPETANEEGKYNLAGFSKSSGIISPEGQNILTVSIKPDSAIIFSAASSENQPAMGFAYRVPQPVQVVLTFQEKELVSQRIDVLQLGPVLTLPPEFRRVEFDMETGALRSVVIE